MPINDDLSHKETPSNARNGGRFYITTKTPKPSEDKVHIFQPRSSTLELWKVFLT